MKEEEEEEEAEEDTIQSTLSRSHWQSLANNSMPTVHPRTDVNKLKQNSTENRPPYLRQVNGYGSTIVK